MQRALLAALFLGPLCALLGVFVTARRMAFFSDTISHGALTGVALGFWLGMPDPTVPLIVFSLLIAGAVVWLRERTELVTDTIMALLLSGSVAIGMIILSLLHRRPGDIHVHFFGTATLSFSDGFTTQVGDEFEIEASPFTLPLRNRLIKSSAEPQAVRVL